MNPAPSNAPFLKKLAQHQRRRDGGIPTLSVLIGPPERVTMLWQAWAVASGRPSIPVLPKGGGPGQDMAEEWLSRPWVLERLVAFLSPDMGVSFRRVLGVLAGEPCQERSLAVERLLSVCSSGSMERLCRHLLEEGRDREPSLLDAQDAACLMEGLSQVEGRRAPGFLLLGFDAEERRVRELSDLLERCPGVPVGWTLSQTASIDTLASMTGSRAGTVFREGIVFLEEPFGIAGRDPFPCEAGSVVGEPPPKAPESPDAEAAADEARERSGPAWEAAEAARSAAEAFLFHRLEAHPKTSGLFELNGALEAPWGPHGRAEVDLLCLSRRLAVEIDGYHHFCSPDGYRRDRRKDVLLQQQGFLVLRFLAEDVVSGLEGILDTILTSLAWREERDG